MNVIKHAAGVLVYSNFARNLLLENYGASLSEMLIKTEHLRQIPGNTDRAESRKTLGIPEDVFVICSFGFMDSSKLNHRLLDAFRSSNLASNAQCRLVFVGALPENLYGETFLQQLDATTSTAKVFITGFVDKASYQHWLAASDLAVQLRTKSRGETSGTILDCLAFCIPTIINAHGSNVEIPDDCVTKLPDCFEDSQLRNAIETIFNDPQKARERSLRAIRHLHDNHNPEHVGKNYHQALEYFAKTAFRIYERTMLTNFSTLCAPQKWANFAANLIDNRQPCGLQQLLLDISAVARFDLKTGIERVVRSILNELLINPPLGYRVEPVCYNDLGGYSYARKFTLRSLGLDEQLLEDTPVQAAPGDLFLGADLILAALPSVADCLNTWRKRGVQLSFIVYDLLPIQRPDCFPPDVETNYRNWLQTVSTVADHLVCISKAVADELEEHLSQNPPQRSQPLQIKHFHLGADIGSSLPTAGLLPDAAQILQTLSEEPTFLMVSTIEPRKGHTQALDAFELLWEQGIEANLAIVGKPGWMTEKLIERLDNHPQQGKRLFCLYAISDEMLEQVYKRSACLLAPSEGEGFGLPLIEAAQHGLPLIVRDIPVFREVAGNHATCFSGSAPQELAKAIRQWLQQPEHERTSSTGLPWLTWQQSVQQLLSGLGVKGEGCTSNITL